LKISALVSTYNNEDVIKETIDSVLAQTYRDFELIIVNDGSTDNTKLIIDRYDDPRIKAIHLESNIGIPNALNLGLEHCDGKYIVKIDGDDIQHPTRFEKQLSFMEQNPQYAMSKCCIEYFPNDEDVAQSIRFKNRKKYDEVNKNRNKSPEEITNSLMLHCSVPHTTMIIRNEIIQKYKYNNLKIFEDYDLFYRLVQDNLQIGHLDETLVSMRVSNDSTTALTNSETYLSVAYQIKEKLLTEFKQNKSIYIWGTGSFARDLTLFLTAKGWVITGYLDSYNFGDDKQFEGRPVYSPEVLKERKDYKIMIAASTGLYEISAYLNSIGYTIGKDYVALK